MSIANHEIDPPDDTPFLDRQSDTAMRWEMRKRKAVASIPEDRLRDVLSAIWDILDGSDGTPEDFETQRDEIADVLQRENKAGIGILFSWEDPTS